MGSEPFIVTAALPEDIFAWSEGLRRAYFPAEKNKLHAHVTLFHSFAPSLFDELRGYLPKIAKEYPMPEGEVTGLMDLGKGTAIALQSPEMLAVRAEIAEHFHGMLTAQDQVEPRLHITVQNKVGKAEARALQAELGPAIEPRRFCFPALELHIYKGGMWEFVKRCAFRGQ